MSETVIDFASFPVDERDRQFGAFMADWGVLEASLQRLTWFLLGCDMMAARTIFAAMSGPAQLRDLLTALAPIRISAVQQETLSRLLERMKTLATRRNRIVHGTWIAEFRERPTLTFREWTRQYHPADWGVMIRIAQRDRKTMAGFRFTVKQMQQIGKNARRLADDVTRLADRIGAQFYPGGSPPSAFFELVSALRKAARSD